EALVHVEDGVLRRGAEANRLEQTERCVVRLLRGDAMTFVLGAVEAREMELPHLADVVDEAGDDDRVRLGAIEVHSLGDAAEAARRACPSFARCDVAGCAARRARPARKRSHAAASRPRRRPAPIAVPSGPAEAARAAVALAGAAAPAWAAASARSARGRRPG